MCGRYAITLPPEAMRQFFRYIEQPNFPPRFNVAPTQPIAVVRRNPVDPRAPERHFGLVRWGFLPGFVKDPKAFPLIINARAEGIAEKASFRAAMRRRRCLVMADAWYEWRPEPGPGKKPFKRPFLFRRRDRAPVGFAGLWETWSDPQGGEIDTGCIVTTWSNGAASAIHDRMPVALDPRDFETWLDSEAFNADTAAELLKPMDSDALDIFEVGPAVGRVANDGPELHEPARTQAEISQAAMGRLL